MFSHFVNIFQTTIGTLVAEIIKLTDMNEAIKFTQDSPVGAYATDDTGVLLGVVRDYYDRPMGIVRLTDNSYILAPLGDLEYTGGEE